MWRFLFVFYAVMPIVWCRLAEEPVQTEDPCSKVNLHCYHRPTEACPPVGQQCRCKVDDCKKAMICCDVDATHLTESLGCANVNLNRDIYSIHIRNATIETLNLTETMRWRRLTSMSITNGQIGNVIGEFGKIASIACLNLSSNNITNFEERSLVNLYNLSSLDLSHNNLSEVPRFKKEGLVNLNISDNKAMLCANLLDAMQRPDLQFSDVENTLCISQKNFSWFNSTESVSFNQLETMIELKKTCPGNCTCSQLRLNFLVGRPSSFANLVNCTSQNLTQLPLKLPPYTTALDISNNQISSLDLIRTDETYFDLSQLHADNNEIESIEDLEGTKFITSLELLSLKNNKIKAIPIYILSNIFDRNANSKWVKFGGNKLLCDCNTAQVLKVWLLTKQKHIPDYDEIYCESMEKVINLDPSKLCQSEHDWTDYIYYIITAEVLLLVGLSAKVSYDYWVFKTAGYLPWPASKMPKLPCDWLCE